MPRYKRIFASILLVVLVRAPLFATQPTGLPLIDLENPQSISARQPILIAHRGGVITATAPECSLSAIRLASLDGYDMVELDIQSTRDHFPVVFHDRNMTEATGREGRVVDFDLETISKMPLLGTAEEIPSLEDALSLCRDLRLGVMLDFKTEGSEEYYRRVNNAMETFGMEGATLTITSRTPIRRFFREVLGSPIWFRILDGTDLLDRGQYKFDRASEFNREVIDGLHESGFLAIPALNTFHYPPESNLDEAEKDAVRLLEAGADGFQIDSVYQHFFGLPRRALPGY